VSGYLDYSGRDDVLSGGAQMIPVNTPAGRFRVFEARGETDNPKYMIACHFECPQLVSAASAAT